MSPGDVCRYCGATRSGHMADTDTAGTWIYCCPDRGGFVTGEAFKAPRRVAEQNAWALIPDPQAPRPAATAGRKAMPLYSGCLAYFPDALMAVAKLSKIGNDKHNPGQPLHWSKDKSADHADCLARHLIGHGQTDPDTGLSHTVSVAWRALALLQTEIEAAKGGDRCSG